MLTITLRGILRHPVRFLLSVLAVVLGIAFISGTLALRGAMADTFGQITGNSIIADAYVLGAPDAESDAGASAQRPAISVDTADAVKDADGTGFVEPSFGGQGVLAGADGTAVSNGGAPTIVFFQDPEAPRHSLALADGRWPTAHGEIAVEREALAASGLAVGDRTTLVLGQDVVEVDVVGSLEFETAAFGATLVAIDRDSAERAYSPDGTVTDVGVYGEDASGSAPGAVDQLAVARSAAESLGDDITALPDDTGYRVTSVDANGGDPVEVVTADAYRDETKKQIEQVVGFISTLLLVFAVVALFVGGFIIANTFTMSVRQRTRELAVLRAIGASGAQVFASVVGQAVVVGILGSVGGIAAGVGLIAAVRAVFDRMGLDMAASAPVTTSIAVTAVAAGLAVSVIASLGPARRASRVPPVAAMRQEDAPERSLVWRGVAGLVLVAGGVVALVAAARAGDEGGPLLGLGASLVVIGALTGSPLIVTSVLRVLAWPFVWALRPMGRLAQGNVTRNPRRTAATGGALTVGMALVGAAAVLAASTNASVAAIVGESLTSDFVVQGANQTPLPPQLSQSIEDSDDVGTVDRLTLGAVEIDGDASFAAGATPQMFTRAVILPTVAGRVEGLDDREAVVDETVAEDRGLAVGDTITVASSAQVPSEVRDEHDLTVVGIVEPGSWVGTPIIVTESVLADLVPEQVRNLNSVYVSAPPGVSAAELRETLVDIAKPYVVGSVMDADDVVSNRADTVNQILGILYALLALSIVIAVLGIINTLALSVIERTREIGLMRAVGLGRLQLAVTIVVESVLTSLFGALLGLAIGIGVSSVLPDVLADQGLSTLAIPWAQLGWILVLVAVAGVLAAVGPAVRAARLPVLKAIASS